MKKTFVLWILILFICVPNVEAKFVTDKLPLLTYAETVIPVYDAPNGTKKGNIPSGNSLVLVKQIRADGWAYGSYKIPNKKKRAYCWFNMNELQGYADFENYIDQSNNDIDAYRTRSSGMYVGKVSSDEDVIVVAKRGGKTKIIFKADGIYYRMGWVDSYNLKKYSTSSDSNNSSDSNSNTNYDNNDSNYDGDIENVNIESEDFSEEFEGDYYEENEDFH